MGVKKYELTDEHREQLPVWRDKWIAIALRTEPQSAEDREKMRAAMRGMYEAAKLEPPPREVFAASPISAAIAAGIGAGIWWIRDEPEAARKLFGRLPSEAEMMSAIPVAVRHVVSHGMRAVRMDPKPEIQRPLAATDDATHAATHAATDDATSAATRDGTYAATSDATYAATDDATLAATRDGTYAATYDATSAATDDATSDATYAATSAATRDATSDATSAATREATSDATDAATSAATRDATSDATYAATYAATDAATSAATRDGTDDATDAATSAATRGATYAATSAATSAATREATRDATSDATSAATSAATLAATYDATYDATDDATYDATDDALIRFLARCTTYAYRLRDGGNQWAGWSAYISFFRHVAGLDLPQYDRWQHYEDAAIYGGPRYTHRRFWVVSDFPTVVGRDGANRPHCETGPQIAWRDGWGIYYVHGIRVPAWIVERPERITVDAIHAESNAEVRRVMVERYGLARYVRDAQFEVLDADTDPLGQPRRLLRRDDLVVVELTNSTVDADGTRRVYHVPCHPELRPLPDGDGELGEPQAMTALNAVASTYGMRGEEYRLQVET